VPGPTVAARSRAARALRRPRVVGPVLVAVAALLIAGCGGGSGNGAPAPDPAASAPPGLESFYRQALSWGPCEPLAQTEDDRQAYADASLQCAKMRVPLDYAKPTGATAEIAILRHAVTDPSRRIGSLVINPGGPGASGVSAAASLASTVASTETGRRFDLVGFDPRGIGASTPPLRCLTPQEQDAERLDDDTDPSPRGVAQTESEERTFVQRCEQRSGNELLANVGTRDVARDMDVLRAVLGEEKLTYLGFSYGTRIGSTYAEQFPRNVRAMVLDGALDPEQDPIDQVVEQGRGFQGAFEAFARDCATQPGCPLGADPAQATARYQQLSRPLIAQPLRLPDGRTLSYGDAQQGTIQALYSEQYWPILRRGLGELAAGRGDTLMRLADLYYSREPDGTYPNDQDAFAAVGCVDDPRVTDRGEATVRAQRYNQAAPFLDSGRGTAGSLDSCAFWPVPPTSQPHVPRVQGLTPPLVISTTGDPATPYQAGVKLAQALNGSLLTKVGDQHTAAFSGFPCVDGVVARYLVDGTPADKGQTCPAT
jgi:pimeloyl-ACP methyl ester carboxylesterase